MPSSATASPALRLVTPAPASATSPEISWPGQPTGSTICPWYQCRSEPQMPQWRTRTTTSPAAGVGRGTSSTASVPGARQKAARISAAGHAARRGSRQVQRLGEAAAEAAGRMARESAGEHTRAAADGDGRGHLHVALAREVDDRELERTSLRLAPRLPQQPPEGTIETSAR